jgi:hypothetical protein
MLAQYNSAYPVWALLSSIVMASIVGIFALRFDADPEACFAANQYDLALLI